MTDLDLKLFSRKTWILIGLFYRILSLDKNLLLVNCFNVNFICLNVICIKPNLKHRHRFCKNSANGEHAFLTLEIRLFLIVQELTEVIERCFVNQNCSCS